MKLISLAAQSTCSVALCVLTAQALTGPASAAGYGLREASTVAMGAAYAGASATGTDASFLAYNPAATAAVGRYDASISMIGLLPSSSAEYDLATTSAMTPAGGDMTQSEFVKTAYVPNLAARMRLSPELSAGLVVFAPWGLATGYDGGWAGRYYAHQTRLMTLNITPTLAYQVTDRLSIAAGPQIQFAKGTLSNAIDIGTIGFLYSVPNSVPGTQDG
jgi:long-chain fatty acid transport protein